MIHLPYPKITHHGRRVLEILQDERDRERSAPLHVVARPLVGAEIGVWKGMNSATLLARAPALHLYMVDYWGDPAAPENGQSIQRGQEACEAALAVTTFAEKRRTIVREPSPGAADRFRDASLDFAFIDGDHFHQPCLADLTAWWPKIKPGGWLMGHDIDHPDFPEWGVRQAVEDFCARHGLTFNAWPSPEMVFFIRKP